MLIFYYIYLILIGLPLLVTSTLLCSIVTIIGCTLGNGSWWGYYPPKVWACFVCWVCMVRVKVEGRENIDPNTSYVFVANHQGAFDIFSIYGYLGHNFKWMMKRSLRKIFLVGYACQRAGHIFVDRSSPTAIKKTIATAESRLRDGMSLVVFPEGSRTFDGKLQPFKKGAYQLALEFKLPLVPITISGAYRVMPRTSIAPRPGTITLTIHKPIPAPQTEAERAIVMEQTREAIASAL